MGNPRATGKNHEVTGETSTRRAPGADEMRVRGKADHRMRLVYLLESAAQLWGGIKSALAGANLLAAKGHDVTVLSKSPPPDWMSCGFRYRQVPDFAPQHIPESDLVIGTDWSTVPFAAQSTTGTPVHFVQGYEGCFEQNRAIWDQIDAVYRLPVAKIVISAHLQQLLQSKFECGSRFVPYMIDHDVMFPSLCRRPKNNPVRVGVVGPYQVDWKDIPTALEACSIAASAGLDLELVRVTNTAPAPEEHDLPFPVEWHVRVPPARMGHLYRSMDVFLASSQGSEEGFFLPAVEAMACGVACVLTDVPCFRSYGSGQYALFVPPKDPFEMAQALTLATTDALRRPLAKAGLEIAQLYREPIHVEALEAVFGGIIADSRASSPTPSPSVPVVAHE